MERAVTFRTIMQDPYRDHPSEDALERFLLNHSDEEELEVVETHFLACETCVDRLEVLEFNMAAAKRAAKEFEAEKIKAISAPESKLMKWFGWLSLPKLSFAGAAAACLLALVFVSIPREVTLVAERGNESATVAQWVPLHMHLVAEELAAGPVTVAILNQTGNQIWETQATVQNGRINIQAPRFTSSGTFVIRIYSPVAGDARGDLVREYAVVAKPVL